MEIRKIKESAEKKKLYAWESYLWKNYRLFRDKHAWLKIAEVFIAIIMIFGVSLTLMQRNSVTEQIRTQETQQLQTTMIDKIVNDPVLRGQILSGNLAGVDAYLEASVPSGISFKSQICPLLDICSLPFQVQQDVYSEEAIVSSNLTYYNKDKIVKLKLFFVRGSWPEDICLNNCDSEGSTLQCNFLGNAIENISCVRKSANCLEANTSIVKTCATSEVCDSGACTSVFGNLTASYIIDHTNVSGGTNVYYNLTLTESMGKADVTLSYRKRCWLDGSCEAPVYDPVAKFGTDKILAGQSIKSNGRWIYTSTYPNKMTETWFGTTNGKSISVSYSINIPSKNSAN